MDSEGDVHETALLSEIERCGKRARTCSGMKPIRRMGSADWVLRTLGHCSKCGFSRSSPSFGCSIRPHVQAMAIATHLRRSSLQEANCDFVAVN